MVSLSVRVGRVWAWHIHCQQGSNLIPVRGSTLANRYVSYIVTVHSLMLEVYCVNYRRMQTEFKPVQTNYCITFFLASHFSLRWLSVSVQLFDIVFSRGFRYCTIGYKILCLVEVLGTVL